MDVIILIVLLIAACMCLFIQHKKIKELKDYINNIPHPENIPNINISIDPFSTNTANRRGIVKDSWSTTSDGGVKTHKYVTYAEVEEIEKLGNFSKIKIIKITGAPANVIKIAEEQMPEIIESSKIDFLP